MPFKTLREFIKLEASGGVILFLAASVALILSNSPLYSYYHAFFDLRLSMHLGVLQLSKPLLLWINDGLMTMFFLLVGLEIKREMIEGELNSFVKAILPAIAAMGGMLVPALIYIYYNASDATTLQGWAIPTATDIAFALGVLSLLGSRVPVALKIFLTAVAIFDDIGAIVVIALFYTEDISLWMLCVAVIAVVGLLVLNRLKVPIISPYILVGVVVWLAVLKSGVHATLAGIILAFAIPMRHPKHPHVSPLRRLEHKLHPWVAFGILPVFAFANAGVSFAGITVAELLNPVTLGIAVGLFAGKQIGIFIASWLGIKFKIAKMPHGMSWRGLYAVSLVAGIGFTMSLFIGSLAFNALGENYPAMVRLGVMMGSLVSGSAGYLVLRFMNDG